MQIHFYKLQLKYIYQYILQCNNHLFIYTWFGLFEKSNIWFFETNTFKSIMIDPWIVMQRVHNHAGLHMYHQTKFKNTTFIFIRIAHKAYVASIATYVMTSLIYCLKWQLTTIKHHSSKLRVIQESTFIKTNMQPMNIATQVIRNVKKNKIHTFANNCATNNVHFVCEKFHSFVLPKFF